jgi:hypothetical protein
MTVYHEMGAGQKTAVTNCKMHTFLKISFGDFDRPQKKTHVLK